MKRGEGLKPFKAGHINELSSIDLNACENARHSYGIFPLAKNSHLQLTNAEDLKQPSGTTYMKFDF